MNRTAVGCGAIALGAAGVCGLAYLGTAVLAALGAPEQLAVAVVTGSLAWLAAGVGLIFLTEARRGGAVASARPFGPAHPLAWLGLMAAVLLAGRVVLIAGIPAVTAVAFPPLHVLAALAPALAIAAHLAWRSGRPAWLTWSGVVRQLVWGAGVAAVIAAVAETVAMVILIGLALVALAQTADGRALLDAGAAVVGRCGPAVATPPAGCEAELTAILRDAAHNPVVALAVFGLAVVIAPMIEELAKAAGVARRRPASRAQAWVWGACTGAGFGVLEAVLYGALGLNLAVWSTTLLARACATLMHATMTAVAGVGWYAGTVEGDWRTAARNLVLAMAGHGAWNALTFLAVWAAFIGQDAGPPAGTVLTGLATVAALGVILVFNTIFVGFLWRSARYGGTIAAETGLAKNLPPV